MKKLRLIIASLALLAAPRLFAAAALTTTALNSGGGRTTNANYVCDSSIGGIVGISTAAAPGKVAKNGYIGQLMDVKNLAISATPSVVPETTTTQLRSLAQMDDETVTAIPTSGTVWSAAAFPVASISTGGLATAATVYADTTAFVTGAWFGVKGVGLFLVQDTNPDNFGSYAGDGLSDGWQVGYFGLDNTNAAPGLDVDGDGFSNLGEYIADTDPTSLFSFLHIVAQSNQPPVRLVYFPSSAIRTYALESATNLVAGPWIPVAGQTNIAGNGAVLALGQTNAAPSTHYRVRVFAP